MSRVGGFETGPRTGQEGTPMADLDRPRIIALLRRLGAEQDAAVLEAARELDQMVTSSGSTWDDLLRSDLAAGDGDIAGADEQEAVAVDQPVGGDDAVTAAEMAEAARLIDRLLARKTLSRTMCDDLADLKRSIAERSFDAMDSRYVRALAKRLGA